MVSTIGGRSLVRNFPCRYLDDERLQALSPRLACRHARIVCGSSAELRKRYQGQMAEYDRLVKLATQASVRQRRERIAAAKRGELEEAA